MASLSAPAVDGEEVVQPRKLGRLRRAGVKAAEENAQPNAAELSPRPAAREKHMLDEGEADRRPRSPAASAELQAEEDGGEAAAAGEAASPSKASSCGAAGTLS